MSETTLSPGIMTKTWTEQEIRQQPTSWCRAMASNDEQREKIDSFLAPILASHNVNIILTGAGTSAFIGDIISPWLSRHTRENVVAVPTTDLVTNPADYLQAEQTTLLVSFARSGNSPESVAAVELASLLVEKCFHLVITCNEAGSLYQNAVASDNAFALLMPAETHDRGFAMTSSITSMMASCLAVFAPSVINSTTFKDVAQRCQQIIDGQPDFSQPVFGDLPLQRIVYLGSGGLQSVARESALKVLELTAGRLVAFYDSSTGFRHGPKSLINSETLVVVFVSSDPYTRLYDLDLLAELRRDKQAKRVVAISATDEPTPTGDLHITLPSARPFIDVEQAFCFLMYAQMFALSESIKAGMTPDNPSVSGTVNRVVQGVNIHPWQPQEA